METTSRIQRFSSIVEMNASTRRTISSVRPREALLSSVRLMVIVPSSVVGRNSEPMNPPSRSEPQVSRSVRITAISGNRIAPRSRRRKRSWNPSKSQFHQPVRMRPRRGGLALPGRMRAARQGVTVMVTHREKSVAYTIVTA